MTRRFHARWLIPVVAAGAVVALAMQSGTLHWRSIGPGVEFGILRGEPWCRHGSSAIALLRVDPARVRVRTRHYSRLRPGGPPDILAWERAVHPIAVFNAGQYYADHSYMGLLVDSGTVVSPRVHVSFRAALVAGPDSLGPEGTGRAARVLDLDQTPLDPWRPGWAEVAQSFMLFDRERHARVRHSTRVANRTAVAEDAQGRLVVAVTEGGYTLSDFAELLMRAPLQLTHAMSMDGGLEAELLVRSGAFRYASFGDWDGLDSQAPGARTPLPAVVTIEAP